MNTGIQDAHNLAWKLAYVMQGIAPQSFLSTYEDERKQIASFNSALSVGSYKEATAIHTALGLDPTISSLVHQAINSPMGSILPSALKRTILNATFSFSHLKVSDYLLNEKNPIGSSRLAKVRHLFEDRLTIPIRFPAEDLGFRYVRGGLVSDGGDDNDALFQPSNGTRRKYIPSIEPGSKLPHIYIRLLSKASSKATIVSTLDLTSIDKAEFVLIIAPIEESYKLAQNVFMVAKGLKIPFKVCVMWPENTTNSSGGSEGVLKPRENVVDVIEIKNSPSSPSWWELCKMEKSGAILVRPDEHVAWRLKSGDVEDPELMAKQVFEAILGLNSR
ncbi:hypothetical protein Leryth_010822 [Lithospermum erythrorhizon]|nr:hypothetical protein Leryth_010822 [Lithospermum erythrorhizon]